MTSGLAGPPHNYHHDLLVGINHLKEKRDLVSRQIEAETSIVDKLKDEVATLNERL